MKTQNGMLIGLAALLCMSCSAQKPLNAPVELSPTSSDANSAAKKAEDNLSNKAAKKPDMKALFGPDYKKGDIGHSTGVVTAIDVSSDHITINHGTVHGTSLEAAVSRFERLPNTKSVTLTPNDKVEFLLKKGSDSQYRLLAICAIKAPETRCLKG